jgi:protease-4
VENQNEGLSRLATAAENFIKQERWSRRWTNLLKLSVIIYILVTVFLIAQGVTKNQEVNGDKHLAVVKLSGLISPATKTNAASINPLLSKAFKNPNSVAVVIKANSGGGSPVQSALINDEITRLKKVHKKPVYVVVEDMCASGCYYIAVAADKIYANKGSMVGSIGVRMDTFGFTGLMDKIGVENRSMHAGKNKTFIDPFSAKNEEGRQFFQEKILERTHQQFIETVRKGRGDRIKENENTYTGLVWLGDEAVENGLIDGLGDIGHIQREVAKVEKVRSYEAEKSVMEQLMGDIATETALKLSLLYSGLK